MSKGSLRHLCPWARDRFRVRSRSCPWARLHFRRLPLQKLARLREEDGGFSTLGMVVALGLALVLVFSGFRVYRVQTASAGIQDVADAAALAAENQVSNFVSVARICDAAVLSFSLAGIVTGLIGVAALCVPATAAYSEALLEVAQNIFSARNTFAKRAAEGLELYQTCLPFLAAARAASVAQANGAAEGISYVALAVLSPWEGAKIAAFDAADGGAEEVIKDAQENADDVRRRSEEAEALAQEANEIKRQAWLLDCGDEERCLRERAAHLAGLAGTQNPQYASVDTWSFNVPLVRCRAYYKERLRAEDGVPVSNPEEAADRELRRHMYRFAVEVFADAYAYETEDGFRCNFPLLPRNMAELRQTELYTEAVYPVQSMGDGTLMMHAWAGCPGASAARGRGSIATLEACGYTMCPYCKFVPSSMGNVCAATSVIGSGFEYYYRQIAKLAQEYQGVQDKVQESAAPAKRTVKRLLQGLGGLLKQLGGERIAVCPPGSNGAICLVVGTGEVRVGGGHSAALLGGETVLGVRVAVSAATLVEDDAPGAASVIRGLPAMLGVSAGGGGAGGGGAGGGGVGAAGVVVELALGLWSALIETYNSGQAALERAAEGAMGKFSWRSSSGLGAWAAKWVRKALQDAGLGAAPTAFLKPVIVNTGLVAGAEEGAWADGFLTVKRAAPAVASGGEAMRALQQVFGAASGAAGGGLDAGAGDGGGSALPKEGIIITVAQQLLGDDSPLTIAFTVLSEEDAQAAGTGSAERAWGWVIGGGLEALTSGERGRDWR